jgi:tripartite-type tricarboxylate transporter receptor subunit TctC
MKFLRRVFLHLPGVAAAVAALSVTLSGYCAWSQAARTMRLVVPYQAGGGNDILARLLGEQIGRTHGATVVIENRPGGGSVIGTEAESSLPTRSRSGRKWFGRPVPRRTDLENFVVNSLKGKP